MSQPEVRSAGPEPMALDHGLDTAEHVYVWANKNSAVDINAKLTQGFRFVKFRDEKARLKDNGMAEYFYREDEGGNICFGSELVLMRGSRDGLARRIRDGLAEQAARVSDAGVSDFEGQVDSWLYSTGIKQKDAPRVSKDADHGETLAVNLQEK